MCLTQLIKVCIARNPSPNSKIITNLCGFLCSDPTYTPNISNPMSALSSTHLGMFIDSADVIAKEKHFEAQTACVLFLFK